MRCIPAPLALTPTLSQRERGQNRQHGRSAQKRSRQAMAACLQTQHPPLRQWWVSNCLESQAPSDKPWAARRNGLLSRTMAFKIVSSFRMHVTSASRC